MKRTVILIVAILLMLQIQVVSAVGILPRGTDCVAFETRDSLEYKALQSETQFDTFVGGDSAKLERALGCAMKVGKIRLYMMPYFVMFVVQFLLQIAGLIAVLFIVYGGYLYVVGGISEDKEKGKKTVLYAIVGLLVTLVSWMAINFIQLALTTVATP